MSELEKAARMALEDAVEIIEALLPNKDDENHDGHDARDVRKWRSTVSKLKALTQALATTERKGEQVAWMLWTHGPVLVFLNKDEAKLEFDRLNHTYPEPARKLIPLYTSPQVPEDVIAILDECRTALMECDRDCDYKLIERIDAIDAARK